MATAQEEVAVSKMTLEYFGWKTLPDVPVTKLLMEYDTEDVQMTLWLEPEQDVPRRFCWRFNTKKEIRDIFVDYGEDLHKLVSIMTEFAPQVTSDNYRGVVAAVAHFFHDIYTRDEHDGEKLVKLRLKGWD